MLYASWMLIIFLLFIYGSAAILEQWRSKGMDVVHSDAAKPSYFLFGLLFLLLVSVIEHVVFSYFVIRFRIVKTDEKLFCDKVLCYHSFQLLIHLSALCFLWSVISSSLLFCINCDDDENVAPAALSIFPSSCRDLDDRSHNLKLSPGDMDEAPVVNLQCSNQLGTFVLWRHTA